MIEKYSKKNKHVSANVKKKNKKVSVPKFLARLVYRLESSN